MARFQARPIVVEAHQWNGEIGMLPESFVVALVGYVRDGPATVPTADGNREVPRGGWIYRGPNGEFSVMSAAAFDGTFVALVEPSGVSLGRVMFIGDPDDPDGVPVMTWRGVRFPLGQAVEVADPELLRAVQRNPHFAVVDSATVADVDGLPQPFMRPVRRVTRRNDNSLAVDDSSQSFTMRPIGHAI